LNFNGSYEKFSLAISFDIAPGLAVGRKWINRNGFSFELLFGVGRNLLIGSDQNWETRTAGTLRMGVSVGKRF
tara:strand:+ start:2950 stop:3168 length:219 start_codon:yes stop_codon:yes gene_type:complete